MNNNILIYFIFLILFFLGIKTIYGDWGLGPIPNPQSPYEYFNYIKYLIKNNIIF